MTSAQKICRMYEKYMQEAAADLQKVQRGIDRRHIASRLALGAVGVAGGSILAHHLGLLPHDIESLVHKPTKDVALGFGTVAGGTAAGILAGHKVGDKISQKYLVKNLEKAKKSLYAFDTSPSRDEGHMTIYHPTAEPDLEAHEIWDKKPHHTFTHPQYGVHHVWFDTHSTRHVSPFHPSLSL